MSGGFSPDGGGYLRRFGVYAEGVTSADAATQTCTGGAVVSKTAGGTYQIDLPTAVPVGKANIKATIQDATMAALDSIGPVVAYQTTTTRFVVVTYDETFGRADRAFGFEISRVQ